MNDSIQTDRTIIIDGRVNLEDYKICWRSSFYKDLPNTLIFWGTLSVGALFLTFLFRDSLFAFSFLLFPLLIAAIPILLTVHSYQSYISAIKKYIASLPASEKHFNLIIKPDGKGIEFMQGENFTFISWESIRGAVEKEGFFALEYRTLPFLIMKREFNNESDIKLFRSILADKFGEQAKLLR